jgi:NADH:ubiquinone oxidoreductase subunit F (NADH-binding)
LRQIINEYGGGLPMGSSFQFALTGGAAGTIVSENLLDIPIDYASGAQGVSLGTGTFLICDQSVSIVGILRNLLHFFTVESCGKCTLCRVGTHAAHLILSRLVSGKGNSTDIAELQALATNLADAHHHQERLAKPGFHR